MEKMARRKKLRNKNICRFSPNAAFQFLAFRKDFSGADTPPAEDFPLRGRDFFC
jgi:hypothetical protein